MFPNRSRTYMRCTSWLERSAVNSIVVESLPFLKRVFSFLVGFLGVPDQHLWAVVKIDFLAIGFDDSFWVIEEVICVNDGDAHFTIFQGAVLAGKRWANLLLLAKVIKDAAKLIVPSFGG